MSGFISDLYSDDPASRYIAAYNSMTLFEQSVAHADMPTLPFPPIQRELETGLTSLKGTAWRWLNDVCPQAKELPFSIVTLKPGIESSITDLYHLKSDNRRDESQVIQVVTLLLGELTPQYQSMQILRGEIGQIYSALDAGFVNLNRCIGDLDSGIGKLSEELLRTLAQRQAAESSTSPDQEKIRNLREQIQKLRLEIEGGNGWRSILAPIRQNMTDAKSSANYLAASWQSFGDEVNHVISILRLIKMKPSALAEIALEHMRQSWETIEAYMSEIVQGLSGVRRATRS